ncbi:MAG: hypothetical protein NDI61_14830, partial [Bdellovibrionaceae bacterium]|nr:hypothetical protein [Pseudobdellovibrionaceae bacterium]
MLALKGHEMGLEVHVLSPSAQDPAAQVVRHHHLGQPMVESDLNAFFSHVDLVTFESEFMDAGLLQRVAVRTAVPIQPRPHVMASLQDRLEQKEWLVRHKIPT